MLCYPSWYNEQLEHKCAIENNFYSQFHLGLGSCFVTREPYEDDNHYTSLNWTLLHLQNSSAISSADYFDSEGGDTVGDSAIDLTAGEIISKLSMQVTILLPQLSLAGPSRLRNSLYTSASYLVTRLMSTGLALKCSTGSLGREDEWIMLVASLVRRSSFFWSNLVQH